MLTMRAQQHPFSTVEVLFLKQSKVYKVENSTLLAGLEPTAWRSYAEGFNRWATAT